MSILIKLSFFFVLFSFGKGGLCQYNTYDTTFHYSVRELQTDFQFLRTKLEKIHPNLYLYTSKAEFDLFFDSLYTSIKIPLTEMEFYNLITLLNSKIKDGHTMFLPSEVASDYFNKNSKFLPFYVVISKGKLYVNMNCSANPLIKEGAEILKINGVGALDILHQLLKRQIRDGSNHTYPIWILTNYFKEYFGFSFGHPTMFLIEYMLQGTGPFTTDVNGVSKDSIRIYRQAKYANRVAVVNEKQGISLEMNKKLSIATLCIKSFDTSISNSVYKQDFNSTIQRIFIQIHHAHVGNLILDIRNNQGGDFEPGKLLLSYLLCRSVNYLPGSKESEIIIPKKNRFKGKLFILINGGSFSSTGIVSSYLESTKRGIFIGEEAAGNKVIISGDPIDTVLPNTKIRFEFSTIKYVIRKARNDGHGVMPTYYITSSINNIIMDKDITKEFVLKLILKKKYEFASRRIIANRSKKLINCTDY